MKKQLKKLKKGHVIGFCIIVILLNEVLRKIPIAILDFLKLSDRSTNSGYLLLELIVLCIAFVMIYLTGQTHILKCSINSFVKSIWSGMIFFVLAIPGCILFAMEGIGQGVVYKSAFEIMAFIVFVVAVGLAEELVFRGIIADSIFEHFGNSKAGVIMSVLLSGCLFGIMHIINVFYGQSSEETIIQMIATSMLGILLSAIYIRHKNIYGVAFLHATLNFMTMFMQGFWYGNTLQYHYEDINFWESLKQSLTSQSVFIIATFFVLRPSIVRKIIDERNNTYVKEM